MVSRYALQLEMVPAVDQPSVAEVGEGPAFAIQTPDSTKFPTRPRSTALQDIA